MIGVAGLGHFKGCTVMSIGFPDLDLMGVDLRIQKVSHNAHAVFSGL